MGKYTKEKECLLKLLQDTEVFKPLSKWTTSLNVFDILKISRTEIRHSNMLGWLLDPNENHGLDDSFLYGLLAKLSDSFANKDVILRLLTGNLASFSVFRERDNIDILLVSSEFKTIIAIENKIGANEHNYGRTDESQLQKYSDSLNSNYDGYIQIKIYLTPEGDEPTNAEWIIMTYSDILGILESVYNNKTNEIGTEASLLIKNYIETIKKNVIMDEELVKLCNEIYNKHKAALDLIFENRDDKTLQINKICKNTIEQQDGFKLEETNTKAAVRFTTETLRLLSQEKGLEQPFYQLKILDRGNELMLEMVFHKQKTADVSEKTRNKINFFITGKSSKIKDNQWEWKRAFRIDMKNAGDKTDDEIKDWFVNAVRKLSSIENGYKNQSNKFL